MKMQTKPEAAFETWTPEAAACALKNNTKNRRLREHTVKLYATQMQRGLWVPNGESVKFDTNGRLIDGQHRLSAIFQSGISQVICTVRNLPPDDSTFATIDAGLRRTTGSVLAMDGVKGSHSIASIILYSHKVASGIHDKSRQVLSSSEIVQIYRTNPEMWDKIRLYTEGVKNIILRPAYGTFVQHALVKNADLFDVFHSYFKTGAGLNGSSPILALRNYLINKNAQKYSSNERTRTAQLNACAIAWNAWRQGKTQKFIKPNSESYNINLI